MISERLLHNLALRCDSEYNISERRKQAIAWSNHYLLLPCNEKKFNFKRLKSINGFDKHDKKSSYHTVYIKRHGETDRMKKDRYFGSKLVRNYIKKETKRIINEDLSDYE